MIRRPRLLAVALLSVLVLSLAMLAPAKPATRAAPLPAQTSPYNRGNQPGRYRGADGHVRRFKLKHAAPIRDGGGRQFGIVPESEAVMLNIGAFKRMKIDGAGEESTFGWAWATDEGSGWIALDALVDPPKVEIDPQRNPKPPAESDQPLTIDAASGLTQLADLRHVNSKGELPTAGGNKGEHYTSRRPGEAIDYVYLLFAVPNVQRGGVAKDSIPDGGQFIPALDEHGQLITETMTMYRDNDFSQPVKVTFLYGRAENGTEYGWLARANVGER
jgi:hypothetical protein